MKTMPNTDEKESCSPRNTTPTQTAVSGSKAPITAVRVEPRRLMASISAMLETTVGIRAKRK